MPGERKSRLSGGRDEVVRFEWLRGRDMEYVYDTVSVKCESGDYAVLSSDFFKLKNLCA